MREYYVVFEGTGEPGSNYKAIRTMVAYEGKEEFEEFASGNKDKIVAQGVDFEEARRLCDETTLKAYLHAAVEFAFEEGEFNPDIFEMRVRQALMLMKLRDRG